jgi:hypothetical protein
MSNELDENLLKQRDYLGNTLVGKYIDNCRIEQDQTRFIFATAKYEGSLWEYQSLMYDYLYKEILNTVFFKITKVGYEEDFEADDILKRKDVTAELFNETYFTVFKVNFKKLFVYFSVATGLLSILFFGISILLRK